MHSLLPQKYLVVGSRRFMVIFSEIRPTEKQCLK